MTQKFASVQIANLLKRESYKLFIDQDALHIKNVGHLLFLKYYIRVAIGNNIDWLKEKFII